MIDFDYLWDFQQPNAATWMCLSLLLCIAAYFRFARFFSLRNWDLISLFLLAPGLLIVTRIENQMFLVGQQLSVGQEISEPNAHQALENLDVLQDGYLWLLVVTGYFMIRCIVDLFLTRRPHLEPNLNLQGLTFLGVSLLGFLIYAVIVKKPDPSGEQAAHTAALLTRDGIRPKEVTESSAPLTTTVILAAPVEKISQRIAQSIQENEGSIDQSQVEAGVPRSMAILCHLLVLTALILIGWQHFDSPSSAVGMATLYLLLPMTAMNVEKIDHLLPSVFLVWAVYAYRIPWLSGILFAMAGQFFYPLFLLPLWIGFYWGRGARWFLTSFAIVFGCMWLVFSWLDPYRTFMERWTSLIAWQAWNLDLSPDTLGFWTEKTQFYRLPILIVYSAVVVAVCFWPKEKNLAELIALSVALILGVQFWYADRGGSYIHWYLPLLLMMIYRPNLSGIRPPMRKLVPVRKFHS